MYVAVGTNPGRTARLGRGAIRCRALAHSSHRTVCARDGPANWRRYVGCGVRAAQWKGLSELVAVLCPCLGPTPPAEGALCIGRRHCVAMVPEVTGLGDSCGSGGPLERRLCARVRNDPAVHLLDQHPERRCALGNNP